MEGIDVSSKQGGPISEIVGANVRRVREVRGMSMRDLAAALKEADWPIYASGIGRLENGGRRIDVDDLVMIAKALDVPPIDLLEPWECDVCHGQPPAGFACETCGARGGTPDRPGFTWGGAK